VLQIFRDERNHSEIAAAYGVSRSHVSSIKRGDSWSWLTGSRDG
jgi:DNA-directed RNA polymerase specialized sigma subunit